MSNFIHIFLIILCCIVWGRSQSQMTSGFTLHRSPVIHTAHTWKDYIHHCGELKSKEKKEVRKGSWSVYEPKHCVSSNPNDHNVRNSSLAPRVLHGIRWSHTSWFIYPSTHQTEPWWKRICLENKQVSSSCLASNFSPNFIQIMENNRIISLVVAATLR